MDVREVQRRLTALGYDPGPTDGHAGPRTRAAVVAFQKARGLWADGIVGPITEAALIAAGTQITAGSYPPPEHATAGWHVREDGRLVRDGSPVIYRGTPNVGGAIRGPKYLVMHFTAGSYGGSVSWLTNREAKASAHFVIGEAGEVTQLAPTDVVTWHAGRSAWKGDTNLNSTSVGIELANLGHLSGTPGQFRFGKSTMVPDSRVMIARHRNGGPITPWHTYPEHQIATAVLIARAIIARHPTIKEILGHDDIAPLRKNDPGPAFDMGKFRRDVLA
jgi:N-acetyl-anhydromuramyl-L-alanine amidase AmpD